MSKDHVSDVADTTKPFPVVRTSIIGVSTALALLTAYKSFDIVPSQSFGVRIQMGQLVSDELKPGWYGKYPLFDTIYTFNNNVKNFETTVGAVVTSSSRDSVQTLSRNTADQNSMSAKLRIHYKLNPKIGYIALHLNDISGDNGQAYLTNLADQSANAVFGSSNATASLGAPKGFLAALTENLKWRIAQNNAPMELDSLELLDMTATVRMPVQIRQIKDGTIEQIAGPAAIDVPQHIGDPTRSPVSNTVPPAAPKQ